VTISCTIETSRIDSGFDFAAFLSATYGGRDANISVSNDSTYLNKGKKFREHSRTTVSGAGISDGQIDAIGKGAESRCNTSGAYRLTRLGSSLRAKRSNPDAAAPARPPWIAASLRSSQ
jgi:hypothetical protein